MSTSPKYGLKEEHKAPVVDAPTPPDRALLAGLIAHAMLTKNYAISAIPKQSVELADAILAAL